MKLKNMTKEELEVLSYTDLTELILKESKKPMNTAKIFKKICDLLELSDEEYASKIGDYYTQYRPEWTCLMPQGYGCV